MDALQTTAVSPPVTALRLWPGETAVILGGGCSLNREDVNYCRGKARVIAIKEAMLLAPWADVLYAGDAKWWRYYKGAPDFKGLKFSIEQDPTQVQIDWASEFPDVQVLRNTGELGLELNPAGLRTGYNSGYQAVNLGAHFGCSKLILLGFDMWAGPNGDQNWFGYHPNHVNSPYPIFHQAFGSIVEPLKQAGVHVMNASRFTLLNAFPRVMLEDVL